jgi:hypothetical protein
VRSEDSMPASMYKKRRCPVGTRAGITRSGVAISPAGPIAVWSRVGSRPRVPGQGAPMEPVYPAVNGSPVGL